MDKSRLDTPRSGYRDDVSSHTKKTKKRSSKRSSFLDSWMNSLQNNQNNDTMPNAEYQHLLWQTNVQQNFPSNGQRLFAATSDPSMCGYAQMPMTYTMEPVSLPTMYRLYQPMPFSGVRTVHGRPRKQYNQNNPMNLRMNSMPNGYSSLQESRVEPPVPINYQNGDYTSLPPTANKNNDITPDELNSEHRRYSDPGIGSADAAIHGQSEESDSVDSSSSITTIGRSNKLVLSLIEQMSELKKSNSQLFKELNETKSELGSMKAQLAQCKYSSFSDYQPGMLSDFIREIRQANKSSEEGLFSKVKSMVEEKLNQRSLEVVNLNNQIAKLLAEKEESDRRIVKLEEEVTTLKLNANNDGREIAAFEEETLALRRELQEARASKSLAENHVAKCVNARSVTPVATFDTTQPYVTSTPVRTALSDTCCLIPQSSSSCSSSSSISQHITSLLRSRSSEVAQQFVTDKANAYPITDCSSPIPIDCSWTMENQDPVPGDGSQSPTSVTDNPDTRRGPSDEETIKETPEDAAQSNTNDAKDQDQGSVSKSEAHAERNNENRSDQVDSAVGKIPEGNSPWATSNSSENKVRGSKNYKDEELQRGHHQRSSSKKGKRRKGGLLTKRSFGEADRGSNVTKNEGRDNARRTVSEDEDRNRLDSDQDETSRAITEIPEVTVVGGGSFVPKDLCSTGILTSRVLTAPSRATYTTAYI